LKSKRCGSERRMRDAAPATSYQLGTEPLARLRELLAGMCEGMKAPQKWLLQDPVLS
jgi:hypothetical protein